MDPLILLDVIIFLAFIITVITVGIAKSRHEEDSEAYFLAGRGLSWWLIGFSLIAANISSEQFIGMSGQAAMHVGLAIASYEWMAAITLVVVAFIFLPRFLKAGIYTIPEFLEYRFNRAARTLMSLLMVAVLVLVSYTGIVYSGALTAEVLAGDQPIWGDFSINVTNAAWIIGTLSVIYVVAGGLKACAWADLMQGSALIIGGAVVMFLAFDALAEADPQAIGLAAERATAGGIERFRELNSSKLHMKLPSSDLILPWTALVVGLWIPNFYYWGLNQYIVQRTLGAQSVSAGQNGVVFAAALKLIIPFIVVIPGIIAFNLFSPDMRDMARSENLDVIKRFDVARVSLSDARMVFPFDREFAELYAEEAQQILQFNRSVAGLDQSAVNSAQELVDANVVAMKRIDEINRDRTSETQIVSQTTLTGYKYDAAFPLLMKRLVFAHPVLRGFVVAALFGAVISSLAAVLNAGSTIFTMDVYRRYLNKGASQTNLVAMGRLCIVVFAIVGCSIAPQLSRPEFKGIFTFIQEFQGFFSPGVLAIFLFGLFVRRAPRTCGVAGILLNPLVYGFLKWGWPKLGGPEIAFLDRMAITFGVELVVLCSMTLLMPLAQPITLPQQSRISVEGSSAAKIWGAVVVLATLALYWVFW
jgi:SSS family solute:Na+ symporter